MLPVVNYCQLFAVVDYCRLAAAGRGTGQGQCHLCLPSLLQKCRLCGYNVVKTVRTVVKTVVKTLW